MAESYYTTKSPIKENEIPCEGLVPPFVKCGDFPKDFELKNNATELPEISITTDKEESTTFAEDDPLGNRIGDNVIKSLIG